MLCPLVVDSCADVPIAILALMIAASAVVAIAILSLTLVPSSLHLPGTFDPSAFDPSLFHSSPLGTLAFPALSFQPLALDPCSNVTIALLLAPERDLTVTLAPVPVIGVVHGARRRLISPDDTSVPRDVGFRSRAARWPRLPSWRNTVDPHTAHPGRRALSRRNPVVSVALCDRRNGSPQRRQQRIRNDSPHMFEAPRWGSGFSGGHTECRPIYLLEHSVETGAQSREEIGVLLRQN